MDFLIKMLIAIGLLILIFTIWNLISVNNLKKSKAKTKKMDDDRYFELKYKYEFLVAAFSFIVAGAGILGYNSIETIENGLKNEIQLRIDSTNNALVNIELKANSLDTILSMKYGEFENQSIHIDSTFKIISNNQRKFDGLSSLSNKTLLNLTDRIKDINSKNILKQNFYIVDSLIYIFTSNEKDTVYFKNVRTNFKDKLPEFNKPPFVIPVAQGNEWSLPLTILKVTNEYFIIQTFSVPMEPILYSVFISENP